MRACEPCILLRSSPREDDYYCPDGFPQLSTAADTRGPSRRVFYTYTEHLKAYDCITSPKAFSLWTIPFSPQAERLFITPHEKLSSEERVVERVLRYLAEQKREEKYARFIREHWRVIEEKGGLNAFTHSPVLRKTPPDPAVLLSRNPFVLARFLTLRAWLGSLRILFRRFARRFARGVHVALIGPDGAGKSFLAQTLAQDFGWIIVYGGYAGWKPSRFPFLRFAREYAYDWYRFFTTLPAFLQGRLILWDRHPVFERVNARGWKSIFFHLAYTLFPKPRLVFLILPPAHVLAERKPEEYHEEQYRAWEAFARRVKGRRIHVLHETGKDVLLNTMLKEIFAEWSEW